MDCVYVRMYGHVIAIMYTSPQMLNFFPTDAATPAPSTTPSAPSTTPSAPSGSSLQEEKEKQAFYNEIGYVEGQSTELPKEVRTYMYMYTYIRVHTYICMCVHVEPLLWTNGVQKINVSSLLERCPYFRGLICA